MTHPLLRHLPTLRAPWVPLGQYPTPVQRVGEFWIKREDLSSPIYGGNKVRTLEMLLADVRERALGPVWALGAYGSNHTVAAILHGPRAGLEVHALLFPQPPTPTAAENFRVSLSHASQCMPLRTIATFPLRIATRLLRKCYVMPPGGAVPLGAFGHMGAALEVSEQVRAGLMPPPAHIVLAIGSTCTTSGLLAGFALARQLGLWPGVLPVIHAVRVTPWPVTARFRVLGLARRTLAELARRGGPGLTLDPSALRMHGGYIGRGYGKPTAPGLEAAARMAALSGPPLDSTYAAKSGAALMALLPELEGPVLFWSTKSSVPLPPDDPERLAAAPAFARRWLARVPAPAP